VDTSDKDGTPFVLCNYAPENDDDDETYLPSDEDEDYNTLESDVTKDEIVADNNRTSSDYYSNSEVSLLHYQ
jgi:hypothetical protein